MPNLNYTGPIQPLDENKHKEPDNQTRAPSPNKITRLVLIIGVIVFLFVGGIISLVFWATSGVTSAADDFMDALSRGDVEEAYEMTSIGFQRETDGEEFEMFLNANPVLKDIESASFNSFGVDNNTYGYARGTVKSKSGEVSQILIDLVNENEEWKVLGVNMNPPPPEPDEIEDIDTDFMDDF